ncbi:MAG: hypothetical protein ACTHQM_12150 [Thermoanaerobaculia bacterium]
MDQNDSNNVTPGGFGTNSGGTTGMTGSGTSSFATGSTTSGFNVGSATDSGANAATETCATCGQSLRGQNTGLEQFLGRLGITDDMVSNLKTQFQNVDIDEYLNTAREYLKDGSSRAQSYAKENPGKVAAGVAALALGAGLIFSAVNRDRA